MTACHCGATDQQFDDGIARNDARRWRRKGPDPTTRRLLAAIRREPPAGEPTLIDVGGGIGAIHHDLLDHGFASATQVDASRAYLAVAAEEAARLGHAARVRFEHGDFRAVAPTLPEADVVTMDRVVCCDPDYAGLLRAAAGRTRALLALSYPRDRWYVRAVVVLANAWRRLLGRAFRVYVHPPRALADVLEAGGLRRREGGGTLIWAVELFERRR